MFHALTKSIEEEFFAENMSAFIALAPCLIQNNPEFTYEDFIKTDWRLYPVNPQLMGKSFRDEEGKGIKNVCKKASEPTCTLVTSLHKMNAFHKEDVKAPVDTRSFLQYAQNRIEGRF